VCVAALLSLWFVVDPLRSVARPRDAQPALAEAQPVDPGETPRHEPPKAEPGGETRRELDSATTPPESVPSPRSLRIRVRDAQGRPIAGVALDRMRFARLGSTGPDGTYLVPFTTRLDLLHVFPLFTEKEGYLARAIPLPEVRATEITVELAAAVASVVVTVMDAARIPLPGACVVLTAREKPILTPLQSFDVAAHAFHCLSLLGDRQVRGFFSTTSDASGMASFCAPAGKYTLIAHVPGKLRYEGSLEISATETSPLRVTAALPAGRELRGRVLDQQTREPVAGARIWYPGSGCDPVPSDEHGDFLAFVPDAPEVQAVRIYHPDHVPLVGEQSGFQEFVLERGVTARLRFVDGTDRPITAPVLLQGLPPPNAPESDARYAYFRTIAPDAQGMVDVHGIEPSLLGTLYFSVPDHGRATLPVDARAPVFTGERVVVTLFAQELCRVALVDSSGSPVEGATLSYTTAALVAGVQTGSSPVELVEDEPGVYLLPSYMANLDVRVQVEARKGNRFAFQVVKEAGQPFPAQARIELPAN
jgi:hypothetical protein